MKWMGGSHKAAYASLLTSLVSSVKCSEQGLSALKGRPLIKQDEWLWTAGSHVNENTLYSGVVAVS